MNHQEKAKQIFKNNKEANEVHFTSDGFGFFELANAEGHASRLKDRTVTTITKDGGKNEKKAADPAAQAEVSDEEKGKVATNPVAAAEPPVAPVAPVAAAKPVAPAKPTAAAKPAAKKKAADKVVKDKPVTPKSEK